MKRLLAILCVLLMLLPAALAEDDDRPFALRFGDRDEKKICITMDDNYDTSFTQQAFDLAKEYDIPITFFVLGYALDEKDHDLWCEIADSQCEIGNHTNLHKKLGNMSHLNIISDVLLTQQKLDAVLGYHYGMKSLRPPYGNVYDKNNSNGKVCRAVREAGYWHVVLWDIAETNFNTAYRKVKNGSIFLFHAKKPDVNCLRKLIPALIEDGYEFVTTSEMFGFDPVERSDELYVFNKKDYDK